MRKSVLIFSLVIVANHTFCSNEIIYRIKSGIFLYNIEKKETVKLVDSNKCFSIGSISCKNNIVSLILYNDLDFVPSSRKRIIREKEYSIKDSKCTMISNNEITLLNENNLISLRDSRFILKSIDLSGKESVSIINSYHDLNERYHKHHRYSACDSILKYNSIEKCVSIFENGKWSCLFKETEDDGVVCGYYDLELSPDRTHVIYLYQCSKYNRKKTIGQGQLLEMNLKDRTIKDLSYLKGSNPKYSKDNKYILYRRNNGYGFGIYEKNRGQAIIELVGALEAYWMFPDR